MINMIPILGWFLSFLFSFFIAIPFYFLWKWLAPIYFYWTPEVYQFIPFWHCVGLFMLIPMIRAALYPRLLNISNGSNS